MELIVATRNAGKLKEIRRLLETENIKVLGLDQFPDIAEVEEDGDTFAANAQKKAQAVALATGLACLADDSGLTVAALGGQPGVHSARFSGPGATDASNNRKLVDALGLFPPEDRQAAFCCVMALCLPGQPTRFFEGRVEGVILYSEQGQGGFGYDPLFLVARVRLHHGRVAYRC